MNIRDFFSRIRARGMVETYDATPEVLRRVRRLEMRTRGFVDSLFSGEYVSVFHGRGIEFSHVRGYEFGDDVRAIDWKVTARRAAPFVRQFIEERDLLVVLMVDVSGSGRFSPGDQSAREVAAEITAALAFTAVRNNDRVALLLVSDGVECFIQPGSGRKHVIRVLSHALSFRTQRTGTDLTAGFEHISRVIKDRASLFVISDFIQNGRQAAFHSALVQVGRAHDLVAVRLTSSAIDDLPDVGWVELTDPESGCRALVDSGSPRVRERYRHSVTLAQAQIANLLTDVGAEIVDVNTDTDDPLAILADFFRRRRNQR